jgi:hypothetical protein
VRHTFVDESHFGVLLRQCSRCGQSFLGIFTETIDWVDGNDPQDYVLCPVDDTEADLLISRAAEVDEDYIDALGWTRRLLFYYNPTSGRARTWWSTDRLQVLHHD